MLTVGETLDTNQRFAIRRNNLGSVTANLLPESMVKFRE